MRLDKFDRTSATVAVVDAKVSGLGVSTKAVDKRVCVLQFRRGV